MPLISPFSAPASSDPSGCERGGLFVYRRTFMHAGAVRSCVGVLCQVEVVPYGPHQQGGVFPHERTFNAARRPLRADAPPILALYTGETVAMAQLLADVMDAQRPGHVAQTGDGVVHELWQLRDNDAVRRCCDALTGRDLMIADGHHRYAAALGDGQVAGGGESRHAAARQCPMVLVGMSDPALIVLSFHRVVSGVPGFSWRRFVDAAAEHFVLEPIRDGLEALERAVLGSAERTVLGFYDFADGTSWLASPKSVDPLGAMFPARSTLWRGAGVVHANSLVIERICQEALNEGRPVAWSCCGSASELAVMGPNARGGEGDEANPQLGILVQPPGVDVVWELSRRGELLPQKATRFHPQVDAEALRAAGCGLGSTSTPLTRFISAC